MNESTAYSCCQRIKKAGRIRGNKSKTFIKTFLIPSLLCGLELWGGNHGKTDDSLKQFKDMHQSKFCISQNQYQTQE